jgi:hypothetical protein
MESSMKSNLNCWGSSKQTCSLKETPQGIVEYLRKQGAPQTMYQVYKKYGACSEKRLQKGGWIEDQGKVEAWAQVGHLTQIVQDTMDWYIPTPTLDGVGHWP